MQKTMVRPKQTGFTLIELLVVVSIIALLAAIIMVAVLQSRQKSRDAKRLADMTQLGTGLELFYNQNRGYPSDQDRNGSPDNMTPTYLALFPPAPQPPDGACAAAVYAAPAPSNTPASLYYYVPSGTPFAGTAGQLLYPDYVYSFCLGRKTGDVAGGLHLLTPRGIR